MIVSTLFGSKYISAKVFGVFEQPLLIRSPFSQSFAISLVVRCFLLGSADCCGSDFIALLAGAPLFGWLKRNTGRHARLNDVGYSTEASKALETLCASMCVM